jgi:peptide/nickel transport system substrate-binding protein
VGSGPTAIAYGNHAVWVTSSLAGTVSRIDSRRAVVTRVVPVGAAPNGIAVSSSGVWVTDEVAGTLVHVSPATGKAQKLTLGGRPESVTLAAGSLWIAVQASGAAHRGGTLRLVIPEDEIDSMEPAAAYAPSAWQILSALYDGLVGFKRVGGSDGNTLVPDLASSLPTPTENGTAYTFRLRDGIKFADGRTLTASAVRSSFERLFRAKPARPDYYAGIVGAPACIAHPSATCHLSKGIVTNDRAGTVTIRLRAPDTEFLYKLALTFASIVPRGTPVRGGRAPLGTGPYRVATYTPRRRLRLVRNRFFHVWSKAAQPAGVPDAIVADLSDTPGEAFTAVERGQSDFVPEIPPARLEEAHTRFAAQLRVTPTPAIQYLILNTKRPPFNDVRARRAVAFAIDRGRGLLGAFDGHDVPAPTCQVIPPNFPSYHAFCPFAVRPAGGDLWPAPKLARAHELVAASGTTGMQVDMVTPAGKLPLGVSGDILEATLRRLGYHVTVERAPTTGSYFDALFSGVAHFEAGVGAWATDYPAPSGMLTGVFACSSAPYSCDPAIDRKLQLTLALQNRDPQAGDAAWARLERELVEGAIVVPIFNPNATEFVSKRLGNYERNPNFGMLISQVWVR